MIIGEHTIITSIIKIVTLVRTTWYSLIGHNRLITQDITATVIINIALSIKYTTYSNKIIGVNISSKNVIIDNSIYYSLNITPKQFKSVDRACVYVYN